MAEAQSRFLQQKKQVPGVKAQSRFLTPVEEADLPETIVSKALSGLLTIPKGIGEAAEVLSDITGLEHGTLGEESRKAQDFLRKRVGKDKASQIIGQAAETITSVGTAILGGAATKIKPLLLLSAGAGLDKTTEALREDQPRLNAYGAGFVSAATEYWTEKIPLNALSNKATGFFTKLAAGAIADIPGEMLATAIELSVIDKQILNKEHHLSTAEYLEILGDTAAVAAISTVGLSGASQIIQRRKRGKPLTEIPDHVSAIQDAIRNIEPIPPAETVVPVEKTHMSEVDNITREDSKSEFIGLQTEDNPIGPRQELDLQNDTRQTAFHGTRHIFDKFDTASIGIGEGAQGFGYGLYFAEKKSIAEYYKTAGGEKGTEGQLLEVSIPKDNQLLNWESTLTKQHVDVRKLILAMMKQDVKDNPEISIFGFDNRAELRRYFDNTTGRDLYLELGESLGNPVDTSEFLRQSGILGHKYFDAVSRKEAGGGTFNFVIYDDAAIEIAKRHGVDIRQEKITTKIQPFEQQFPELIEQEIDVSDNTSVDSIYEEQKAFKREQGSLKKKISNTLKSIRTNVFDVSSNLKGKLHTFGNAGKHAVIMHDLMAGAGSKAADDFNIIEREIFSGMNQQQTEMFDKYNFALNHLSIRAEKGAKFKLPNNTTEQKLQDFIDSIPAKDKAQMEERSAKLRNAMKFYVNLLHSEGLETEARRQQMNQKEYYIPRQVLEYLDPIRNTPDRDGKVISVHDSGLKKLSDDGSDKLVDMDTKLLMQQVAARTYARVFKNRAAKAMADLARTDFPDPESQKNREDLIRLAKVVDSTKSAFEIIDKRTGQTLTEDAFESEKEAQELIEGDEDIYEVQKVKVGQPVYETPGPDERSLFAMENGKLTRMIMPKEMANEWILRDPILSSQASWWIGWLSGSRILKAMATGVNPEFAITNIPRDMAHIYLTTEEYSAFAPKFIYQMQQDIKEVANDVELNGKLSRMYTDLGGGMDFLSQQHRDTQRFPKVASAMNQALDIASYMGTKSEMLTRLSLMNRALKNGKSPQEAVWIARNYLDFSQGGSLAKMADTAIPYLNASIQGARGIGRAFQKNPKLFGIKVGNIATAAIGLFLANFYNKDPETGKSVYEDVPESDKVRNWIITTPLWFRDEDGTKRYYYMKIPKDQGQRVFATAAESMMKLHMGMPVDGDAIADSVLDFLPILPTDAFPPTMDAMIGYMVNKDFWQRKDIWRGPAVTPPEEYTKYTPVPYRKAGELLGASPERLKYGVEQYFTKGNIWTSLVGYGAKQVFDELDDASMEQTVEELFTRKPGIRRFLKATRPESEQQRRIKEAKIEANTERRKVNRAFDELTEQFYNGRTDQNEIEEFLRRRPNHEIKRLMSRFKRAGQIKDIPNRRLWLNLLDLPPEYRAINYWNTWTQLDEAGRRQMDETSLRVPGFRTKRFNEQFNKMQRFGAQVEGK
jgi:hypothetical protein